jgi:hypothetical protein
VIERFLALASGGDGDFEVLFDALLPDVLAKHAWTKREFKLSLFR